MRSADIVAFIPLITLVATMPVFAIRSRGQALGANLAQRPSVLLGNWLRSWMIWALSPLERLFVRRRLSPDILNWLGGALGLFAGGAFIARELPLAAWLIGLGGICDILDGRLARARGIASAYGDFLDAMLDRFTETFMFVGIAWYLSGSTWIAAATVLAIAGSLLVSYARAFGEALGVACTGGLAQRAERLALLGIGTLLDSPLTRWFDWPPGTVLSAAVVAIAAGSVATAIYRGVFIARRLARRPP
jgi:CDP-diacylglycerol--glycerol-3-phosphate 3-phosphatidyltransferase